MGMPIGIKSCSLEPLKPAGNPNPDRWELIKKVEFKNAYVLKVRYFDATNFEGIKISVYKGKYKKRLYLDPHFDETGKSPFARLKPTVEGWNTALKLAESL